MADEDLVTVDDLQGRLDWVLDDGERGVAEGAIADLSNDARYYGLGSWEHDTAPRQVASLVLRAAARFMRNPDGYTQSRAGDETLAWTDLGDRAGTAYFTTQEQRMLADLAGKNTSGLYSVEVKAWDSRRHRRHGNVVYVPIDGGGRGLPFYQDGVDY